MSDHVTFRGHMMTVTEEGHLAFHLSSPSFLSRTNVPVTTQRPKATLGRDLVFWLGQCLHRRRCVCVCTSMCMDTKWFKLQKPAQAMPS